LPKARCISIATLQVLHQSMPRDTCNVAAWQKFFGKSL